MAAGSAWVLNLDAELELAVPAYTPKRSVRAIVRELTPRVAASLLAPGDVLIDEESLPGSARGRIGCAFCPTPRAIALLERAGAAPAPHPSAGVLARVLSRAFSAGLGPTMPDATFVTELDAARAILSRATPHGAWRIKRAYSMSGRGHRVVRAGAAGEADLAFVRAGLSQGGLQIEPNVSIEDEFAIHGAIARDGAFELGAIVRQRCDRSGAWIETTRVDDDESRDVAAPLAAEAELSARALFAAGYFGPFGVDAFTYRGEDGTLRLRARSEINARYTMGYAIGFGRHRV